MRKPKVDSDGVIEDMAVAMPRVRHLYSPRVEVLAPPPDGPGADQSQKDDCDINRIMKRFMKTGILGNPADYRQGYYGDIAALPEDFLAAEAMVLAARDAFGALPSDVRERFRNSPVELLTFLHDPANREEAIKLGFISKKEEPTKSAPSAASGGPPGVLAGSPAAAAAGGAQ